MRVCESMDQALRTWTKETWWGWWWSSSRSSSIEMSLVKSVKSGCCKIINITSLKGFQKTEQAEGQQEWNFKKIIWSNLQIVQRFPENLSFLSTEQAEGQQEWNFKQILWSNLQIVQRFPENSSFLSMEQAEGRQPRTWNQATSMLLSMSMGNISRFWCFNSWNLLAFFLKCKD